MAGGDNKTESATPKRRRESRRKGQVARSTDISTAAGLMAGFGVLAFAGERIFDGLKDMLARGLVQSGNPELATTAGLGYLTRWSFVSIAVAIAPVLAAVAVAAVVANVAQVKLVLSPQAMKPSLRKLDPVAGFKRVFGPNAFVEGVKAVAKTAIIGGIAFLAIWPHLRGLGALVGMPPAMLAAELASIVLGIAWRATAAMVAIAALDYLWQRRRHEKQIKMTKDETKREAREADIAPELRGALRRKQIERSRRRMLSAVPDADVVVVNPTHFAVALRYDGTLAAPQVVAKGMGHVAATIRKVAEEHGVPIVSNPPLARTLCREVELDAIIPEAFFAAVAEVLAFVYRTAGRRTRAARPPVRRRPALARPPRSLAP